MDESRQRIYDRFVEGFRQAVGPGEPERRVGAELKLPLVRHDGSAVSLETLSRLWDHLAERGWTPVADKMSGKVVGARLTGERNDHVASCETGYAKTEFSLAHVADLETLERSLKALREVLRPFAEREEAHFLGYGIHPVSPPGETLLMKKERTSFWDRVFPSNRVIPAEEGDDMHLFTVNAASHVHVSVSQKEAVRAVNVLNGFSGAQLALMGHSSVWRGAVDETYKDVAEMFWDWWEPVKGRVGVPHRSFRDMADYIHTVADFPLVYVKRDCGPVIFKDKPSFAHYFGCASATGQDLSGSDLEITPSPEDLDVHNSCYWYNARISRYYTVENRVYDQQPPADLVTPSALTLGLICAAEEAWEEVSAVSWDTLRASREEGCRAGLGGSVGDLSLRDWAGRMLDLASKGLKIRGRGEERYLETLYERVKAGRNPADEAEALFRRGGISALLEARRI